MGLGNSYLTQALERCGYRTRGANFSRGRIIEQLVPFHLAPARSKLIAASPADLAFYDDEGLSICPPSRRWARTNVVFYHGLLYNPGTWMGNDAIDLHCGNSPYLARVLRALLAFPDWEKRRCLDPRAFQIVSHVTLPLPSVEEPDGSRRMSGADVPRAVRALLESGEVIGHALQPGKHDFSASVSILFYLNEMARKDGRPAVRLLVADTDLTAERVAALQKVLRLVGRSPEDFYVPVPRLSHRALFKTMRACAFGLSYNTVPESFGFYVLESVHNGCPLFTNGVGNIRHLLPPGHGIEVFEDFAMTQGRPEAYEAVARRIHDALADRAARGRQCRRGASYIDAHYNRRSLQRDLAAALERLEGPAAPETDFDALTIELGPLVRHYDAASGTVISDLESFTLSASQAALLPELLGRKCGDLSATDRSTMRLAQRLFARGVLSLSAS